MVYSNESPTPVSYTHLDVYKRQIQKASQYFSEHEGAANAAKSTITGLAVAFGVLATALLLSLIHI